MKPGNPAVRECPKATGGLHRWRRYPDTGRAMCVNCKLVLTKSQADETFWTYQAASKTPTLDEAIAAKAIAPETTQAEWDKMTPGMKREVVRSAELKQ